MKSIITLAFVLLLGYLGWDYYTFLTDPSSDLGIQRSNLERKKAEVVTKERKIEDAKSFYASLERKREELRQLSHELATMKSTLTETIDIPAFMKLVLGEAKKVGLSVTSLSPMPSVTKPYYIEQPFDLAFQGVYVQFVAFLDRLSQAERIVRVDDFAIKPRNAPLKGGRFVDLEGTLKVKSYVYLGTKEDELAAKGANGTLLPPSNTMPGQSGASP
jgi:Tfp pilus assembly protein PilO